jgi:hypothetical protein
VGLALPIYSLTTKLVEIMATGAPSRERTVKDDNPYKTPTSVAANQAKTTRRAIVVPIILVVGGGCASVANIAMLGAAVRGPGLLAMYRQLGWVNFTSFTFFTWAYLLISLLSLTYLVFGRPSQGLTVTVAVGGGAIVAALAVGFMECCA